MKDVLEYSEEELRSLPNDVLINLLKLAESLESKWHTSQLVSKTLINSLYGALANKYFLLFNEEIAAAITGNGRYFIRKMSLYIEEALQKLHPRSEPYVLYNDTDSGYYTIEPFMEMYQANNPGLTINQYVDWADQFEKKVIQPVISRVIEDFANELNAYDKKKIRAEREIIADAAVFCAKKKYYARVRDSEGTRYSENDPKIKVMGLEIIKSSTPKWSQKYLKQAIPHILDKDENDLRAWINDIKNEFASTDLNMIAQVGGVSRLDYDLNAGSVPIGSRAAIKYNQYIEANNLKEVYEPIKAGDKTKRLFLTTPNVFDSNIIAYTNDTFAKEIEKHKCVDYDTNFEKGFMNPLKLMVGVLNYNLDKQTESLDDW